MSHTGSTEVRVHLATIRSARSARAEVRSDEVSLMINDGWMMAGLVVGVECGLFVHYRTDA